MAYLMGIDLGTSSVKAMISDEFGNTLALGHAAYEVIQRKAGYAEQDPQAWWSATVAALRSALEQAMLNVLGFDAAQISGIGFSGQMHGLVCLDGAGQILRPAMIWMDQRSGEVLQQLETPELQALFEKDILNKPAPGFMLASLLWIKSNEPACFGDIRQVLLPKDYIRFRLTGEWGTDETDASATLCYNIRERKFSNRIMDLLALDPEVFPRVHRPWDVIGTVTQAAAFETGLKEGTTVVCGGADAAMQLVGNGIIRPGMTACNIGTGAQIATVIERPLADAGMRVQTWIHAPRDTWYIQGGTLNGGNALKWTREKLLKSELSYAQLDILAGQVEPGSQGLMFMPYLAGERTPFQNPDARGAFHGLGLGHDSSHILRAVLEGITYNLKASLEIFRDLGISPTALIASGGGSQGETWCQIQADIFNLPVYRTKTREAACLGAIIMAAVGTGIYADIEAACTRMVQREEDVIVPGRAAVDMYAEGYEQFRRYLAAEYL